MWLSQWGPRFRQRRRWRPVRTATPAWQPAVPGVLFQAHPSVVLASEPPKSALLCDVLGTPSTFQAGCSLPVGYFHAQRGPISHAVGLWGKQRLKTNQQMGKDYTTSDAFMVFEKQGRFGAGKTPTLHRFRRVDYLPNSIMAYFLPAVSIVTTTGDCGSKKLRDKLKFGNFRTTILMYVCSVFMGANSSAILFKLSFATIALWGARVATYVALRDFSSPFQENTALKPCAFFSSSSFHGY